MSDAETMRLDRFLWFARLAKTRDVAQALACDGHLRLDGRAIDRAHAPVRVGNILTFFHGGRVRVLRIEALPRRRGPAPEAQGCYQELALAAPVSDPQALTSAPSGAKAAPEN
ncbi:ribosome-associated heat shock protein Hsp15 [Sphingomonas sp. BE138]|uniref:RNA-binding S4 domain-containing protein n=1 Tax=Sphingomonas sp. BE138 TaxID=2817845 RepID=UPI0028657C80|nr:RNA-binding S4 domain-containing protein [Sphingomonas sp. BE138]MDR6789012.1 ribosome-associated heat shock protein Hsp15 [Sphingomonas sp. BE138]